MSRTVEEFIECRVLEEWSKCFAEGLLDKSLQDHWRNFIPIILPPSVETDAVKVDRRLKKFVLSPMEKFLCAGDPETIFKLLKEKDQPPQLCGHVFKMGEPTYTCRDCGVDPTCVLCIQCFQKSDHRRHRYRDPVSTLPADLRERAEQLYGILLQYILKLLRWETDECADNLPRGLQPEEPDNTFVTMLFNDEVHTYEQVISTLMKAIECSKKEATNFATVVDREGRSAIKIGNYEECNKAKDVIERTTTRQGGKRLKVLVMRSSIVSHQLFAVKLLAWLQDITSKADGLRNLFCRVALEVKDGQSVMERMLLLDTNLWKVARINSHQLFMAGVLMEPECKKKFAMLYTQLYPRLIKDFIQDDHDHSVCVVSESVQIFTVPTLARMLITDYNLISVLLRAFLEECKPKIGRDGKFAFERSERNQGFRRAQYVMYDVKYALTCKPTPEEWNDSLRRNFMDGFSVLLDLLKCMQGMDCVTRQSGQHLEFEPEWEGAFNLQLRLNDSLTLFLDWCGTDRQVLIQAYNKCLRTLSQCRDQLDQYKREMVNVGGHEANVIRYDVSTQPVSIHLPVSRLLTGLHLCLEKFGMTFFSPEMNQSELSPVDLIEPPLRTLVMIAQTQAGMWRRNGYSLLNQIFFYSNVRCRGEMYDKDVVLLQSCAAMIESNEFVIHLLNKFGLLVWIREEYDNPGGSSPEDPVRQTIILAEEFLNLLIILIGERYSSEVGEVTATEMTKREVIHQLCITPMAHSNLSKALSEDDEVAFDSVIGDVAEFKKPTGSGKGVFVLKDEYYTEYNPYFYHYSRSDQTKSEEQQRKRKKLANEDQALPPPVPPPFITSFSPVINILTCDVMIFIMKLILMRTAATRSRSWSENQFEKVLHLIGLALHEDKKSYDKGEGAFCFIEKATRGEGNLLKLLESLVGHPNLSHDAHKDLLTWIMKKFSVVRKLKDVSVSMETVHATAAALDEKAEKVRRKKADVAAKRRAKLMAQMSAMQKNFIKENAELFEKTSTEFLSASASSAMDISEPIGFQVAVGAKRSPGVVTGITQATCILCQEEQDISFSDRAMVLAAFIQRSTVLSRSPGKVIENGYDFDPLFIESDLFCGTHTSTCGHVMHSDCWQRLIDSVLTQERRRMFRFRHHPSFDIDKMEFLCPLCETISNSVIPIIPPLQMLSDDLEEKRGVELSFNNWIDGLQKTVEASVREAVEKEKEEELFLLQPCPLPTVTKMMADSVAKNFQALYEYVLEPRGHFSDTINEMIRKFSRDAYSVGLDVNPDDDNHRVPVMAWSTCAYSIQVIEQCLRAEGKPLFGSMSSRQTDCLCALVRLGAVVGQVVQPDEVRKHCIRLLTALLPTSDFKPKNPAPCVLAFDMFHHFAQLCFSVPTLYGEEQWPGVGVLPTGGLSDQHLLELTMTAHVVQIMLGADFNEAESMEVEGDEECEPLMRIFTKVRQLAGQDVSPTIRPWQLHTYLRQACAPFLRCAALFFHNLTGVSPPSEFQESSVEQFETLCRYLSLPAKLSALFDERGDLIKKLVESWCSDTRVKAIIRSGKVVQYPMSVNRLIPLPHDYSDMVNDAATFRCPQSDDDSRAPTQCLVCGKMVCSQSYCCQTEMEGIQVGAATAHARTCGAGVGLFLRVRECQILLLSGKTKGCFYAPPYLDDYGETDQGLRRGNPLHLCSDSYKRLHKLWLSHAIPEEITHCLESNTSLMSLDWQHI
ncbi:E3 ubiquitin-protein ligase UBR2-like isoform X2 [Lineus longissimus]|uniref:E3 ubiquitin-protein ligase UBR2-like isoform X2 n=1 Tax=Lineus longissimus TaxID=88925 RepID=UPI00315C660F